MDALINFLNDFQALESTAFAKVMDKDNIVNKVIFLNTRDQLFDKGIDSKGDSLEPEYTEFTKSRKGDLPIDRVTLFQEGDFYGTWRVYIESDALIIDANPVKTDEEGDTSNLFHKYGEDVLGLTDESIEKLKPLITESVYELIKGLIR